MKRSQKRVLIVDDELRICALISKLLKQEGLSVETVSDGAKAIETAKKRKFSLILMDLRMFDVDGERAITAIEKMDTKAKFLIVTGYVLSPALEKKIAAGLYGYMAKPFDNHQLVQKVKKMIGGRIYGKTRKKPKQNPGR